MDLIYETVHGSRAFGLAREGSDTDLKGIVVGPPVWYLGPDPGPEQVELGPDHVRFELRKFLRLAARANPMALEMLFADPSDHQGLEDAGRRLLEVRDRFVTAQVGDTFGGYALGQLKRIQTHRQWLLSPPKAAPVRADFGLPERPAVAKDQLGAAEALLERDGVLDASPAFLATLGKEKQYRSARARWQQYQQWKKSRNPKRSALEAKYGFDTKHALHLVRLQRMAVEILETGVVQVRRTDRDELLAIRDGAMTYEQLLEVCASNDARIRTARAASDLPESVDGDFVEALCVELIERVRGWR